MSLIEIDEKLFLIIALGARNSVGIKVIGFDNRQELLLFKQSLYSKLFSRKQ